MRFSDRDINHVRDEDRFRLARHVNLLYNASLLDGLVLHLLLTVLRAYCFLSDRFLSDQNGVSRGGYRDVLLQADSRGRRDVFNRGHRFLNLLVF